MRKPAVALNRGAKILSTVLLGNGFRFVFHESGRGSGGEYAWGEFVRGDRRLELHFRQSLGLVRYHVGNHSASHEIYMRELGVVEQAQYPGFDDDPGAAFHHLAHDLAFADDFLSGNAAILTRAAAKEASAIAEQEKKLTARYVGDVDKLERLHEVFKQGRYSDVILLAEQIQFPDRMMESERRMVEIARRRANRADTLPHTV